MMRFALLLACGAALLALLVPVGAEAATTGTVEGTVTPPAWAPEVEVCVVEREPGEICTAPAADGSYRLLDVPFGGARIEFVPSFRSGLLGQYYDGVEKLPEARTIVLSALSPLAQGVDADLIEGGAIEGTVTAAGGGAPLPEIEACAVSVGSPTVRSCGETDAAGGYGLHSLPAGTYRVGFRGVGTSAVYEPWTHPAVGVAAGHTTVGVDAVLGLGAQIRGIVTAAAGGGRLADVPVCLFAATAPEPQRCTYSEEAGGYSFVGLPGGSYQVGFSLVAGEIGGGSLAGEDDGFESQYYDGVGTRGEAATITLIPAAVVGGVDASLVTPQSPGPLAPAPPVASPTVAAPPTLAVPGPRKAGCGKGHRRKKVEGEVRCVRHAVHNHKGQKHKKGEKHKKSQSWRTLRSHPARG
jgi:hypothetical protein